MSPDGKAIGMDARWTLPDQSAKEGYLERTGDVKNRD